MKTIWEEIVSNYEELAALHGELYYALDVVPADADNLAGKSFAR